MANIDTAFVDSFNRENGEHDGNVTFEEALVHVNGLKLNGPLSKPLMSDRAPGDVNIGDFPLRDMSDTAGKVEQFVDINLNLALDPTQSFWDNTIYRLCSQAKYSELPPPFCLQKEPNCPYSLQIILIPSTTVFLLIKTESISIWSSTSTCTRTSFGRKIAWPFAKDRLCAPIGEHNLEVA